MSQKTDLLLTSLLDDVKISCSEPIIGLRSTVVNKPKMSRGLIPRVSLDLGTDDVMKETKASKAIRLFRQDKGQRIPSNSVLLVFDEQDVLPDHVTIGYTRCQGFNHVAKSCRGKETCLKCARGHSFKSCPNKDSPKGSNCQGPHSAAYKSCPKYKVATQVVQIASKEGISYAEAVNKQKSIKPTDSASVSAVQSKPIQRTIKTQTEVLTPKSPVKETKTEDEEVSRETQTETAAGKKRQVSQQAATGSRSKKRFEDLTEAEFFAGDDGDSAQEDAGEDMEHLFRQFLPVTAADLPKPVEPSKIAGKQAGKGKAKK